MMMTDRSFLPRRALLAPLLFALGLPVDAAAYTPACYREVQQHCGDVEPGGGRLTDCVARNQNLFSTVCRAEVHAVIEQRGRFTRLCKESAESLCPGIKPGKGRLYACLKFNEERVAPPCKTQLE